MDNVDNSEPPQNKILVGSFEGKLRIYTPTPREFKIEDMPIEKDLGLPILQVACAQNLAGPKAQQFLPSQSRNVKDLNAVAVLHSRKLVIAMIVTTNDFSSFQEVHSHTFNRNAFNFVVGCFGQRQ